MKRKKTPVDVIGLIHPKNLHHRYFDRLRNNPDLRIVALTKITLDPYVKKYGHNWYYITFRGKNLTGDLRWMNGNQATVVGRPRRIWV